MAEQQKPNKEKKIKGLFFNRNLLVFLSFVVLSFFLWFLNYLSKNLTSDLTIKYRFKNIPKTISDNNASSGELTIMSTGQGYNLLQESLKSRNLPLAIDLESLNADNKPLLRYSNDNSYAYIVTNDLKPLIRKKLVDKITLNDIKPDTIFFEMVNVKSKIVPIDASNVTFDLIPGQKITKTSIVPDSISIIGQGHLIDSIEKIYVSNQTIENIKSDKQYNVTIDLPDGVNATQNTVDIEYKIEMFTEANKKIKITPINFPSDFDYSLLPSEVSVFYSVTLPYYDKISEYDFKATVDYSKAVRNCIEINVTSKNPNTSIIKYSPETCTFILDKK